jgi:hypothetical protein
MRCRKAGGSKTCGGSRGPTNRHNKALKWAIKGMIQEFRNDFPHVQFTDMKVGGGLLSLPKEERYGDYYLWFTGKDGNKKVIRVIQPEGLTSTPEWQLLPYHAGKKLAPIPIASFVDWHPWYKVRELVKELVN